MSSAWFRTMRRMGAAANTRLIAAYGRSQQGCVRSHMRIAVGSGCIPLPEAVLPLCVPFRWVVVLGSIALGAVDTVTPSSASID